MNHMRQVILSTLSNIQLAVCAIIFKFLNGSLHKALNRTVRRQQYYIPKIADFLQGFVDFAQGLFVAFGHIVLKTGLGCFQLRARLTILKFDLIV